mgnify:CR=1 FL=1
MITFTAEEASDLTAPEGTPFMGVAHDVRGERVFITSGYYATAREAITAAQQGVETVCECPLHEGETRVRYQITHHDGETSFAWYCPTCFEMAEADWNGETRSISPAP